MEKITSIKDERVELARTVKSRKGRLEYGLILLEGEEIIDWAIANSLSIEYIILSEKADIGLSGKYKEQNIRLYSVSEGIIKKITDTNYVIPVVGVAKISLHKKGASPQLMVVLDSVRDFGNIGTIIRTCQAFGIRNIISTASDTDIFQRKTIEASRGTVFSMQHDSFNNSVETIRYLKEKGYQIVATSPRGRGLQSLVELKPQPVALVIGNETNGISPEFEKEADFLLQIPMYNSVESLNAGVAAGISIYEIQLKQAITMIEERIKSTLGRELNVAGMLVKRALDTELKKVSDLSGLQVVFMMVLKCDGKMRRENMCRQFGILESEADEFIRPMQASGLIDSGNEMQLTPKGEDVLGKLWITVENTEDKILSGIDDEEAVKLLKQLSLIQQKCVEIIDNDR